MDDREERLLHEPLKVDDFVGSGTITDPDGWVVAQVNGNPMSDKERNEVASRLVTRWNAHNLLVATLEALTLLVEEDLSGTLPDDCLELKKQLVDTNIVLQSIHVDL